NSTLLEGNGGGIFIGYTNALIVQNLITGNLAFQGGGIYMLSAAQILVNNTIADNDAAGGSGIFTPDRNDGTNAQTELTNNIIVAKQGQPGLYCGGSHSNPSIIRFNNIFSNGGMAYAGFITDKTGMNGNISADPLFANPFQGDYHLLSGSPSID